nr:cytochrome-c peroxidase [Nitrosomonas sp.]
MKLILLLLTFFLSSLACAQENAQKPNAAGQQAQHKHENGKGSADHGHGHEHADKGHSGHGHGDKAHDDHGHDHGHGGGHHGHGHKLDETQLKQFFEPLPESIIDAQKNAALIALGKKLYLDPRLSVNDKISCNSCHSLSNYGVDSEPTSPGHEGKRGGRNSPTTFNAALHVAQFWDGRASTV